MIGFRFTDGMITLRSTVRSVNENYIRTKQFVFHDFSLTWINIIENFLIIPGFP